MTRKQIHCQARIVAMNQREDFHILLLYPQISLFEIGKSKRVDRNSRHETKIGQHAYRLLRLFGMQVDYQVHIGGCPDVAVQYSRDTTDNDVANIGVVECSKDRNYF